MKFLLRFILKLSTVKSFLRKKTVKDTNFFLTKNKDRHAICEDGEGHTHNFFFACNKDEIIEICELSRYILGYRPQYVETAPKWENFECSWLWVDYDIDEYGPVPALGTVSDFIELQEECVRSYNDAVQIAKQIRNIPGPRS